MNNTENQNIKIFTENIEQKAMEQIEKLLSIDAFNNCKIRIMPDVHAGAGCVIGFTGDLGDKVIPNIVGVDIGCGIYVQPFECRGNIDFHALNEFILKNIPSGRNVRDENYNPLPDKFLHLYREAKDIIKDLRCYRDLNLRNPRRLKSSIGSLGGGNHFIELDKDNEGMFYLAVHTGSRNLGKRVAEFYQKQAIKEKLPVPQDLAYLTGEKREAYLHDMKLCQRWAEINREIIATLIMDYLFMKHNVGACGESFESVHNYIAEDNIIRKGAISAKEEQHCIIPLNMRDGSLICTGKGNDDWNSSAPHGAGRIMSRAQAFKEIEMAEFIDSMAGIYSETVSEETKDESPMVYKPKEEILKYIEDTVTVEKVIKPVFNFKAAE